MNYNEVIADLKAVAEETRIAKEKMVADLQDCNTAIQAIIRMQQRRDKANGTYDPEDW